MQIPNVARTVCRAVFPASFREAVRTRRKLAELATYGAIYVHIPKTGETSVNRPLYGDKPFAHRTALSLYAVAPKVFKAVPSFFRGPRSMEAYLSDLLGRRLSVPTINTSGPKVDYRSFYTARMVDIVAAVYARDIELFSYSFGATLMASE